MPRDQKGQSQSLHPTPPRPWESAIGNGESWEWEMMERGRRRRKKGSSGISGERRADLEEKVRVVAKAVGHPLEHLDLVIHAFEDAGVQGIATVRQDAGELGFEMAGELDQGGDPAPHGPPVPGVPGP